MSNITLSVPDDVIRQVHKIAIDKNTTLTAMVRDYLASLAARDSLAREQAARALEDSFARLSRPMGPHTWTRQELHERGWRFIDTNVVVYAYDSNEPAEQPAAQPVEQPVAQKLLKQAVLDEDGVNGTTALSS